MAGEGKRCGPSLHIVLAVALKSCVIDMARKEMTIITTETRDYVT